MTDDDPVQACLDGTLTPELAIARLVLAGDGAAGIRRRIQAARNGSDAWRQLDRLAEQTVLERLTVMLETSGVDHARASSPAAIAASFDRAVAVSPEASVAFYSLGDHARLRAATDEIRDWLRDTGLLRRDMDVLDLGCGIGRVAAAIAPHVGTVVGLEVSAAMARQARLRCAHCANVACILAAGRDLAMFADAAFDLVLAVDTFPYLVQAGVAETHVAEARRVLRSAGQLVVLNLSYRGSLQADQEEARCWASRYGFDLHQPGVSPFRTWDASVHIFARR